MMRGRCSSPCPGCGAKGAMRKATEVCHECQTLIKEAKARRAQVKRIKDTEPTRLPFAPHCLPALYRPDRESSDTIKRFVFDLIKLVGQEISWNAVPFPPETNHNSHYVINGSSGCDSSGRTYWLIPKGLKEILNELYSAIQTGSEAAYQEGQEHGHNLIMGLATGETTIDELNEATISRKSR